MNLKKLNERRLITSEDHFMPVIFADLPALLCGALVGKTADKLSEKTNNAIGHHPTCHESVFFTAMINNPYITRLLLNSIDDITY